MKIPADQLPWQKNQDHNNGKWIKMNFSEMQIGITCVLYR